MAFLYTGLDADATPVGRAEIVGMVDVRIVSVLLDVLVGRSLLEVVVETVPFQPPVGEESVPLEIPVPVAIDLMLEELLVAVVVRIVFEEEEEVVVGIAFEEEEVVVVVRTPELIMEMGAEGPTLKATQASGKV